MSIRKLLKDLSEDDLRQKIIIPLFVASGCNTVRDTCGSREYGKDIFYRRRHFLRKDVFGAVLIKKTKITKVNLATLERQIREAVAPFISHESPTNKIRVDEVVIVTSQHITQDAMEYIYQNAGAFFPSVHFVDGTSLEFLITQLILEYNRRKDVNYVFDIETFQEIFNRELLDDTQFDFTNREGQIFK